MLNEKEKQLRQVIKDTSLEDIIRIKLEETSKIMGDKFFGFSLWESMFYIVGDALLNFVERESEEKAAMIFGVTKGEYILIKKSFGRNKRKKNSRI